MMRKINKRKYVRLGDTEILVVVESVAWKCKGCGKYKDTVGCHMPYCCSCSSKLELAGKLPVKHLTPEYEIEHET